MLTLALVVAVVAALRGMWSPCGLSMLSSLNPVSERARGNRFWLTECWYVAGATVGGMALGVAAAFAAFGVGRFDLATAATWTVVLVAALIAVASDTAVFGRSLPDHPRQVDERWLVRYRRWVYAAGYGVQIGSGFATYIMTAAVYLTVVLAVLTGSPGQAFAVCVVFGAVRGLTILVAATARTPERLRATHQRLAALDGASLLGATVACAAVAVVAGYALGGGGVALAVVAACAAAVTVARSRALSRRAPIPGTAR
ncbi:MAG TPA: hypothetical protein VH395_00965 [Jatrophihabitantaceae bacterium]|jgi:hypothetical protein